MARNGEQAQQCDPCGPCDRGPNGEQTMRTWTRTAGLLFLAASAVYNGKAIAAGLGKAGSPDASTAAPASSDQKHVDLNAGPSKAAPADSKDSSNPFKDSAASSSKDAKDSKDATADAKDSKDAATTGPSTAPVPGKSLTS